MKKNWEIKKLGEVCDFQGGSQPPKSNFIFEPRKGYVRFLQIRDFKNEKNITYIPVSKKNRYCEQGDILLGRYGASVGKVLTNKAGAYNVAVMKTIPDEEVLNKQYFYHYLTSNEFQGRLLKISSRSAQNGFSKDDIYNFPVVVPALSVQKRIVSILDKLFADIEKAKANAEKNLKNSKEIFESYLQSAFENKKVKWQMKKLGDVCDTGAGGTPLKSHKDYYDNGNIPWLRSGEIDKKNIIESELYITKKGLENSSAKLFPSNTVLIAMYGATAGQVGILRFKCSTNQAVCGIFPNKNIIPEFLYYKFLAGKDALVKQAVGGAQPNISQIKIKNTLIPIISLNEQQSLVKKLDGLSDEVNKLDLIYSNKLKDLLELKKSILQKAFNGEL